METAAQFPVDRGTVVEVACSFSDAVSKGSNEVTCTTGTVFTFLEEPSCSVSGLFKLKCKNVTSSSVY